MAKSYKQKYNNEDGVWRTIGGRRVFIRTGQSLSSAMRESGKFKNKKSLASIEEEYQGNRKRVLDERQEAFRNMSSAERKYGDLSEESKKFRQEYNQKSDELAQLDANRRLDKHAEIRKEMNVDMYNESGLHIKKEQFDRLKEVGNINRNQADYENTFIDHKKKMAEIGKYEYFDNRYNKAYDEAMNAQDKFNSIDKSYESMYGKEERDRMFQQSMDTMDRATEGKKRSQEFKKGKEIKEMLRANETNQDDLWNRTGYNFNDLKDEENFNEANRLLGNNYQKEEKSWRQRMNDPEERKKIVDRELDQSTKDKINDFYNDRDNFISKALEDDKIRISNKYESPNGISLNVIAQDVSGKYIVREAGNEYRVNEDELRKILSEGKYEKTEYRGVRKQTEDLTKINETTTYDFGKIDAYGNGRKSNRATVEMKLNNGVFTASGNIWNSKGTDIISGGQNLDELKEHFGDNENFNSIYNMWKKYHLNDMHAGTEKQEEALMKKFGNMNANNYDQQVEYLKSIGLYEDNGYRYGSGWLKRDIPQEDLKTISGLIRNNNLKERYSDTYDTLKELGLSEAEIMERLKKIDKKGK